MNYKYFCQVQHGVNCIKEEMEQMTAPFCTSHGVTGSQLRLILALHMEGEQTVSQLARMVCMADTNVSTQVKRLCEREILQRRRHAEDERQVFVSLAPLGQNLALAFVRHCEGQMSVIMAHASNEEQQAIQKGMEALAAVAAKKA